jgi:hypothetical protein
MKLTLNKKKYQDAGFLKLLGQNSSSLNDGGNFLGNLPNLKSGENNSIGGEVATKGIKELTTTGLNALVPGAGSLLNLSSGIGKAVEGKGTNAGTNMISQSLNPFNSIEAISQGRFEEAIPWLGSIKKAQRRQEEEKKEGIIQGGITKANNYARGRANANLNLMGNRSTSIYQIGGQSTSVAKKPLFLPDSSKKKEATLKPSKIEVAAKMEADDNLNFLARQGKFGVQLLDPTGLSNSLDTYDKWQNYNKGKTSLADALLQTSYQIPMLGKIGKVLGGVGKLNQARYTTEHLLNETGNKSEYFPVKQAGGIVSGGKAINLSSTGKLFKGNKHSEGGIDIMQEGTPAEVEDGEVMEKVSGDNFIYSDILINPETKRMFSDDAMLLSAQKGSIESKGLKLANKFGKRQFIDEKAENSLKLYDMAAKIKERELESLANKQEQVKQETMQVESGTPESQIGLSQGGQRMEFNNVSPNTEFTGESMDRPVLMQLGTQEDGYMNIKDTKVLQPGQKMKIPNGINKVVEQKLKLGGKLYQTGKTKSVLDGYADYLDYSNRDKTEIPLIGVQSNQVLQMPKTTIDGTMKFNNASQGLSLDKLKKAGLALAGGVASASPNIAQNADIITAPFLINKDPKYPLQATTGYYNPSLQMANTSPIKQAYASTRKGLINNSAQNQNIQLMALASREAQDVANEQGRVNNLNNQITNEAQLQNIGISRENNVVMQNNQLQRAMQERDRLAKWQQLASQISNRSQAKARDKKAGQFDESQIALISKILGYNKQQKGGKLKLC